MEPCGMTMQDEVGYCAAHLAEMYGLTLTRVNSLRRSERLEAMEARTPERLLACGKRKRGFCLFPMGVILCAEEDGLLHAS